MEGIEGGTSSGYVSKSVRDQYIEGIDHFLSIIITDGVPISVSGGRHHLPA